MPKESDTFGIRKGRKCLSIFYSHFDLILFYLKLLVCRLVNIVSLWNSSYIKQREVLFVVDILL